MGAQLGQLLKALRRQRAWLSKGPCSHAPAQVQSELSFLGTLPPSDRILQPKGRVRFPHAPPPPRISRHIQSALAGPTLVWKTGSLPGRLRDSGDDPLTPLPLRGWGVGAAAGRPPFRGWGQAFDSLVFNYPTSLSQSACPKSNYSAGDTPWPAGARATQSFPQLQGSACRALGCEAQSLVPPSWLELWVGLLGVSVSVSPQGGGGALLPSPPVALLPSFCNSNLEAQNLFGRFLPSDWASLVAQMIKNPPAMEEMWVWSLGMEGPLEKEMATRCSSLAWRILTLFPVNPRIPLTEEPCELQSMGLQRVWQGWVTNTLTSFMGSGAPHRDSWVMALQRELAWWVGRVLVVDTAPLPLDSETLSVLRRVLRTSL